MNNILASIPKTKKSFAFLVVKLILFTIREHYNSNKAITKSIFRLVCNNIQWSNPHYHLGQWVTALTHLQR